jgi:RNA polymerase sigma-70 factor (ECF subfamily)
MVLESRSIAAVPTGHDAFVKEFGEIYREHYRLVYRTAYSVTGRRQDAEDVLQTVFIKLLENRRPRVFIKNPKAYLYRAAVNTSLNIVRARKRHDAVDGVDELRAVPSPTDTPSNHPLRRKLLDAIARLKPQAVEILVLRYEHDYTDEEIAKVLGTSRGTIAVALNRIRKRLKKSLRISGDTP